MATLLQLATLRNDAVILQRIEAAIAKKAVYLLGFPADPNYGWAVGALINQQTAAIAQRCAWEVVANPVLADGVYAEGMPGVPDDGANGFQAIVESVCTKY